MTDSIGTVPAAAGFHARSISVIVTAMNEEGNLAETVVSVVNAVAPRIPDYEVIIVNDGSTDRTATVANALAAANPRIRVHHNPRNIGLGRSYKIGIDLAAHEYTSWVAGNNIISQEALERLYDRVGERDMVISYVLQDVRGWDRRTISRAFTIGMNLLFSTRMRYWTGPCVYRSSIAKRMSMRATGSLFVAELLVRLLRAGQTYVEIGLLPKPRTAGSTKTFRVKNVVDVFTMVLRLFWELRVEAPLGIARPVDVAATKDDHAFHSR
jgi:dolichol-phosphate mannosyltransferase